MPDWKVDELWTYPVKSTAGQQHDDAAVDAHGLVGDRRWAVQSADTGLIGSAKDYDRYGALMECRSIVDSGGLLITLPGGDAYPPGPDLDTALSSLLGHDVHLVEDAPGKAHARKSLQSNEDDEAREHVSRFERWTEIIGLPVPRTPRHVDMGHVHLIWKSTLDFLESEGMDHPVARLRPNVVVDGDLEPFGENDLVGTSLSIGTVELLVVGPTARCSMVSRPGLDAAGSVFDENRGALSPVNKNNRLEVPWRGKKKGCVGVNATVVAAGSIARGDSVIAAS